MYNLTNIKFTEAQFTVIHKSFWHTALNTKQNITEHSLVINNKHHIRFSEDAFSKNLPYKRTLGQIFYF